jgi:glucosamine-6-phosphate deaminase
MNLLVFDSASAWAEGVATYWRDRLRRRPRSRICLASGNTPRPVYAAMTEAFERGWVSFSEAEIFALDEYGGLSPDDPARCANMLRRDLLDHVDVEVFCFLNPEVEDLARHCRDYELSIGRGFDLAILGIGLNGHLGLNEPGSAPDSLTRRMEMAPESIAASRNYLTHDNLPTWGLTVGLKSLLDSKEVWLLATGPAKAGIIRTLCYGDVTPSVPASLMRQHPNCTLFLDTPAAAGLR